jgi:hypothetical protein
MNVIATAKIIAARIKLRGAVSVPLLTDVLDISGPPVWVIEGYWYS